MFVSMPSMNRLLPGGFLFGLLLLLCTQRAQPTRSEAGDGVCRRFGGRIEDPPNVVRRGNRFMENHGLVERSQRADCAGRLLEVERSEEHTSELQSLRH